MCKPEQIIIVGPSPDRAYQGGVATHIRSLMQLSPFKDSTIFDPGAWHSAERLSSIIRNLFRLRRIIEKRTYKLIMVNASIYPSSFTKLLAILSALPRRDDAVIYVFFHGGTFENLKVLRCRPVRVIARKLLRRAAAFYFLTDAQAEGFIGLFHDRETRLFANYGSTDALLGRSERQGRHVRLLFVGRVVRSKGIFEALEAIRRLKREGVEAAITIAGDGEDIDEVRKVAATLPPESVEVCGCLRNEALEEAYRRADALLLPSYSEAFPYVAVEAMRAGLPIISTAVGVLKTLVREGTTGLHVEAGNVDSVVDAVRRIQQDRQLLERMSRNCHDVFRKQLSKTAAEKYYGRLCSMI